MHNILFISSHNRFLHFSFFFSGNYGSCSLPERQSYVTKRPAENLPKTWRLFHRVMNRPGGAVCTVLALSASRCFLLFRTSILFLLIFVGRSVLLRWILRVRWTFLQRWMLRTVLLVRRMSRKLDAPVVFLFLLLVRSASASGGTPIIGTRIVHTRYGKLQGMVYPMDHSKHLKPVEVFLGIPYATPPVLSNRFSPTRTPSPWDGIRIADKLAPVCPQNLPGMCKRYVRIDVHVYDNAGFRSRATRSPRFALELESTWMYQFKN